MKTLPRTFPWTHCIDSAPGRITAFNVVQCDKCGDLCEGPNAVTIFNPKKGLPLTMLEQRLPEISYHEGTDQALCEECYSEADRMTEVA